MVHIMCQVLFRFGVHLLRFRSRKEEGILTEKIWNLLFVSKLMLHLSWPSLCVCERERERGREKERERERASEGAQPHVSPSQCCRYGKQNRRSVLFVTLFDIFNTLPKKKKDFHGMLFLNIYWRKRSGPIYISFSWDSCTFSSYPIFNMVFSLAHHTVPQKDPSPRELHKSIAISKRTGLRWSQYWERC